MAMGFKINEMQECQEILTVTCENPNTGGLDMEVQYVMQETEFSNCCDAYNEEVQFLPLYGTCRSVIVETCTLEDEDDVVKMTDNGQVNALLCDSQSQ